MSVKSTAIYQGDLSCELTHEQSGSVIQTEAPLDNGGKGTKFSPTDLVAGSLGACVLTLMGIVAETGLRMNVVDYVPCYRSEAGTGNAMAFAYWK